MKAVCLPPLIAIAAGLTWVGYQHHRLDELGREAGVMRQAIEVARRVDRAAAEAAPPPESKVPKALQSAFKDNRIQWDKVLELIRTQTGDIENLRLQMALKKQFATMTPGEMEVEFERIAAMGDLSDSDRQELQQMLLEELASQDPRWVVQHLFNQIGSEKVSWSIGRAFTQWVAQDLPSAIQWIDQQVAAGGFDSKSLDGGTSIWLRYENEVLRKLMQSDPAAAMTRLKALPDDLRGDAFNNLLPTMKPGESKAYVDAMRSTVPAAQYNTLLDTTSRWVVRQGMDQMNELISTANFSQEERNVVVNAVFDEQLVRSSNVIPQAAAIDGIRDWAAKQAPQLVDRLTGTSLGEASGDFQARAALALQYADKGNGDEVLSAFLRGSGDLADMETAASLLDHVTDETLRAQLRQMLQTRSDNKGH